MNIYWVALAAAICTSLGGQVLLKAGAVAEGHFITQLFRPTTVIGLAAYGGAALLYIVALRKIPMSVALPCTAASYVAVALIGHFMFGEALGTQKLAAIGLICGGVVLLASAHS
ncbi:MAG: multidrug transporter [Acetobacteraceae bacterium]|nr:MAG: multidrug transporter [Acetobacteraceae bacterium]